MISGSSLAFVEENMERETTWQNGWTEAEQSRLELNCGTESNRRWLLAVILLSKGMCSDGFLTAGGALSAGAQQPAVASSPFALCPLHLLQVFLTFPYHITTCFSSPCSAQHGSAGLQSPVTREVEAGGSQIQNLSGLSEWQDSLDHLIRPCLKK